MVTIRRNDFTSWSIERRGFGFHFLLMAFEQSLNLSIDFNERPTHVELFNSQQFGICITFIFMFPSIVDLVWFGFMVYQTMLVI